MHMRPATQPVVLCDSYRSPATAMKIFSRLFDLPVGVRRLSICYLLVAAGSVTAADKSAWLMRLGDTNRDVGFAISAGAGDAALLLMPVETPIPVGGKTYHPQGPDALAVSIQADGKITRVDQFGSTGADNIQAIAGQGDALFVTGYYSNHAELNGQRVLGETRGQTDAFITRVDAGKAAWSITIGGEFVDAGLSIAADEKTVVALLEYQRTATVSQASDEQEQPILSTLKNQGGRDTALIVLGNDGRFRRAISLGGAGEDKARSVRLSPDGRFAYVMTQFNGTFSQGNGGYQSHGSEDILIWKIDLDSGKTVWRKHLGGAGTEFGAALAVDGNGRLYAAGSFSQQLHLDDQSEALLSSNGVTDGFVISWNADGTLCWSRQLGGEYADLVLGMDVTEDGRVYAGGYLLGDVHFFDGGQGRVSTERNAGFVVSLNQSGQPDKLWTLQGDKPADVVSVVVGQSAVYVTGTFNGTARLVPEAGLSVTSAGKSDAYVLKLPR